MPVKVGGGGKGDQAAVRRATTVTFEPPPAWGPGQVYKDGTVRARFKAFLPTLSVSGVAQEGQTITASVSFPSMPPGHPAVSLRVLVTWLREDIGKYWLTDGDALARSKLRQRGVYEPNNFIPSVDLRDPEKRRYTVIEGATKIDYVCHLDDIGRRVGVKVQPISASGQLGEVYSAWSSEVLISFPHCTFLTLHDTVTCSDLSIRPARGTAAAMQPEAGVSIVFPVVGHTIRADFGYIGGEPGEHAIKWWRVGRRGGEEEEEEEEDELVAFQTNTYEVTMADNEHQLRVEIVPVRCDGTQGCAREVYTGRISAKCFFSSAEHVHTRGFCPFELSQADTLAKHIPAPTLEPPRTAGIGLVVREGPRGEQIVKHMLPGMPAAKCGKIKVGDVLVEVDGEDMQGKHLVDVIPGPEGTAVRLKFERERTEKSGKDFQREFEVELTRSSPADTISSKERAAQPQHNALNSTFESVVGETKTIFSEVQSVLDPLGVQPLPSHWPTKSPEESPAPHR